MFDIIYNKMAKKMYNIKEYTEKTFESIKHIDEYGNEFWEARELMPLLEYSKWENFHKVIKRAKIACETSNNNVSDHFPEFREMVDIGSGKKEKPLIIIYLVMHVKTQILEKSQ